MSFTGSGGDDQSEDGELRHSPIEIKPKTDEMLDFSLSEEDAVTADSLDIKPPQARSIPPHGSGGSGRSKRRDRNRDGRSRHGRSERHRGEQQERGSHGHREKHHRERSLRDGGYRGDKEHFRGERDLYRDKEIYLQKETTFRSERYTDSGTTLTYKETKFLDYRSDRSAESSSRRSAQSSIADDTTKYTHDGTSTRELRYLDARTKKDDRGYPPADEMMKQQRRYDDKQSQRSKSIADQTLDDLRERLLDKKRQKESGDETYPMKHESRRKQQQQRDQRELEQTSSAADADLYVKEIIDLSAENEGAPKRERTHRGREEKEEKEWSQREENNKLIEKKLSDAEREEQELRKEKLLEAEREIARQKEQYKLEKELRHQRRQERQEAKRRLLQEQEEEHQKRKRLRMSGELGQYKNKEISIVTVSDNSSDASSSEKEQEEENVEEEDEDSSTEDEERSDANEEEDEEEEEVESVAESASSGGGGGGGESETSVGRRRKPNNSEDDEEDRRYYNKDSPPSVDLDRTDRSATRSRTRSKSPKNNGQDSGDKDAAANKETKAKSPEPVVKKLDAKLPGYYPAIQGCRSVEEFQCLNRIEEGTYGVVYRAKDKRTEEIVALKRLKMEKEKEGFPITSLREINTLLKGQHPNIVTVREIVVGSNMDKIFIVMDYVEHDLKSLMETMRNRRQVFVPGEVKCLLKQLLGAVAHLHDNWILHRDLKTSNLLLSHKGILKVGDFGLAREYGSPLKAYTPIVVTLWYRAPELLLCCKEYSTPIDMWSVGCIFAELLLMNALFPGKSEVDQLNRIFKDLGTPNEKIWPGYNELPAVKKMKFTEFPMSQLRSRFGMLTELGQNLLQRFLTYDPKQRVTADDALKHPYFNEAPLPIDPAMFPTWPAKSELGHRKAMAASPNPPSGGREYKQLGDGDEDSALGFHMGTSTGASTMEARRLAMGGGFSLKF